MLIERGDLDTGPKVVPIPTISLIAPEALSIGITSAPISGAYPIPPEEPNETISPPLGT